MASKKAAVKTAEQGASAGQALFDALKDNPYVQRILADEDLRDQVRDALDNGRSAYKRASKAKRPAHALINDKKLQKDLRAAFTSARDAQSGLRAAPSSSTGRKGGKLRLLVVAAVGTGVALVASSGLRDKVLDLLFGPEETFDYVPTSNGNGTGAAAAPAAAQNAS